MSFMSFITPQIALSFGISLSLAVTIGCAVGIHQNSITNTLLDWFIFAFLGTLTTCLLTQTHPSYPKEESETSPETSPETLPEPVSFCSIFNRGFFAYVGVLVFVGTVLQVTGLVNLLVSLSAQYVVPLLNQGWRFVLQSFTNSSCVAFLVGLYHGTLNILGQGCDAFMEAVNYVTNVFSNN